MSVQEKFQEAQARIKTLTSSPGNDKLLQLYALYKQGENGDASGKRPGMLDIKGRAKYDAWAQKKGMSKDQAMEAYVALVDSLVK